MEQIKDIPDEFINATPIEGQHRYLINTVSEGTFLWFGLRGLDGEIRYNKIGSKKATNLSIEILELARATKLTERGGHIPPISSHMQIPVPYLSDGTMQYFVGAELKIHRAGMHFSDLEDIITFYSSRLKILAKKIHEENDYAVSQFYFSQSPPAIIPLILGDILHNLRSSLDHMIFDLVRKRSGKQTNLSFPFERDEATFKELLKKKYIKELGREVCDELLALKPFKVNGDELLRALRNLENADKHKLILPTYLVSKHKYDIAADVTDQLARIRPEAAPVKIAYLGDGTLETAFIKEGDTIKHALGEDPLKYFEFIPEGLHIWFASDSEHFPNEPILPNLFVMINKVMDILTSFKAKFIE